jgi:hypothetical protein
MSAELRFNVVAIDLGKRIYYAAVETYGFGHVGWEALPPEEKANFVDVAAYILRRLDPHATPATLFDHAASLARAEAAKVIGTISPVAPWGERRES